MFPPPPVLKPLPPQSGPNTLSPVDPALAPTSVVPGVPPIPGAPLSPGGHSFVTGAFDPLESILGVFPAVRIRGLPFSATLEDVLIFFQGLVVVDVVLDKVKNEGLVLFANLMDFQMALTRDRHNMGRRYIEDFQGKRMEYYAAIVSAQQITARQRGQQYPLPPHARHQGGRGGGGRGGGGGDRGGVGPRGYHSGWGPVGQNGGGGYGSRGGGGRHHQQSTLQGTHTGYLRLRGLPFQATAADVKNFFEPHQVDVGNVALVVRQDGRMSGEAYVKFEGEEGGAGVEEGKIAAEEKNRGRLGQRYIEIFIANKEEVRDREIDR